MHYRGHGGSSGVARPSRRIEMNEPERPEHIRDADYALLGRQASVEEWQAVLDRFIAAAGRAEAIDLDRFRPANHPAPRRRCQLTTRFVLSRGFTPSIACRRSR